MLRASRTSGPPERRAEGLGKAGSARGASQPAGPARRPSYALCCDDSGGEDDAVRSVACVSGPASALLELERALRGILARARLAELKWSALRTRRGRLAAARSFLDLAVQALAQGRLRVEVLLWRPSEQARACRERADAGRLRPLYGRLWQGALKSWPPGRWNLRPDQRTGMRWREQAEALGRVGRGRVRGPAPTVRAVREASSRALACVQLADLLAGLCRVEDGTRGADGEAGARARSNRRALRDYFEGLCLRHGLAVRRSSGLLDARHPRLNLRLLRRLPVRP